MTSYTPTASRRFAVDVVRTLRDAGYEALWAGGCVRDQLLGLTPKDYDVATNAHPEQIRQLFGFKRTLPVGAAFGVITVIGPREAGHIEVATFRCDGAYLDGRHPTGVTFSTPELDAQRRDFTINGLFFDPLTEEVHDYVGGEKDLKQGVIRAIRNPYERFQEDKLRMLRAVRFAATFDFSIEPETMQAIQNLANEIVIVSAERIAAEMRRMLVHPRRALAVELLKTSDLLNTILPESSAYDWHDSHQDASTAELRWKTMLALLEAASQSDFPTALALLIRGICRLPPDDPRVAHWGNSPQFPNNQLLRGARYICQRWKLSNEEQEVVEFLLENEHKIRAAEQVAWPQLQPLLVHPFHEQLLNFCSTVEVVLDGAEQGVRFCREKLALSPQELNPEPFITGNDLIRIGLKPGPKFKSVLQTVRNAQLLHQIHSREEAIELVRHLHESQ